MADRADFTWHLPAAHLGRRVAVYHELPSTNDLAAELAEPGLAVLALRQTRGRGQYGRTWDCPSGAGLLLSAWASPPSEYARPVVLTALATVAVADFLSQSVNVSARIKWPNDLLVEGRKICGILIEQRRGVVIGVGLNLNQTADEFQRAGLPDAVSLLMLTGRTMDVEIAARGVLAELDRRYSELLQSGPDLLESDWQRRVGLLGQVVELETTDGMVRRGPLTALRFAGITVGGQTVAPELARRLSVSDAT